MNRTALAKDIQRFCGHGMISVTELGRYLGDSNSHRVKQKFLQGVARIGKRYFVPEVADKIIEIQQGEKNYGEMESKMDS